MRRTKIVATIGPASRDPEVLVRLVEAGIDVARLNFSHGDENQHAETIERIRAACGEAGREVAILGDLPGPKLRIGAVANDRIVLEEGDELRIVTGDGADRDERTVSVSWDGLPRAVSPGEEIYLADGTIRVQVTGVEGDVVSCEVEHGGILSSHKGLNLPGSTAGLPAAGERDLEWVEFAVRQEVDLLALSFVRRVDDLELVERRVAEAGSDIPVIPKFEKPEALANAEEIVVHAIGGIMIARGDLGIELPIERVPGVQKRLISLAGRHSTPVITATQMLASMVTETRPTRAEVTDVANAIYDGTDAIMLSEETAVGDNPVGAVQTMARIAVETERDLPYSEWAFGRAGLEEAGPVAGMVAWGAVVAAERIGLSALVVPTLSGRTARIVSARRPKVPILALSSRPSTVRRVKALFGVKSRLAEDKEDLRDLLEDCADRALEAGVAKSGDLIGVTAGLPEQGLGTNLFEVHRVP